MKWIKLVLKSTGSSGERILSARSQIEKGETIECGFELTGKLFALGGKITLNAQDYLDIVLTFLSLGAQVHQATVEIQNRQKPTP